MSEIVPPTQPIAPDGKRRREVVLVAIAGSILLGLGIFGGYQAYRERTLVSGLTGLSVEPRFSVKRNMYIVSYGCDPQDFGRDKSQAASLIRRLSFLYDGVEIDATCQERRGDGYPYRCTIRRGVVCAVAFDQKNVPVSDNRGPTTPEPAVK